MHCIKKIGADR